MILWEFQPKFQIFYLIEKYQKILKILMIDTSIINEISQKSIKNCW